MKTNPLAYAALLAALTFSSCKKDAPTPTTPPTTPTTPVPVAAKKKVVIQYTQVGSWNANTQGQLRYDARGTTMFNAYPGQYNTTRVFGGVFNKVETTSAGNEEKLYLELYFPDVIKPALITDERAMQADVYVDSKLVYSLRLDKNTANDPKIGNTLYETPINGNKAWMHAWTILTIH